LPVHDAEPLARAVLDTLSTPGLYYGKVCTDAVKPYRPEAILPAFFETLKQDQEIRYL